MAFYVGHRYETMTVFESDETPTGKTHGKLFNSIVGPFKTQEGAEYFRDHAAGNPHCYTVEQAERLAAEAKKKQ